MSQLSSRNRLFSLAAVCLAVIVSGGASPKPRFQRLGILPGYTDSFAADVTNDASVVVGTNTRGNIARGYRWTAAEGMVDLGVLPGSSQSTAEGVSADGSVIVGETPSEWLGHAFRWTKAGGLQSLGVGGALDVSSDGSIVVGYDLRWTESEGRTPLPIRPGHNAMTPDGSVVVGYVPISNRMAARWTIAGGVELLGDLPGGNASSFANGVSADGSVVVGWSSSFNGNDEAFRWSSDVGMVGLGDLPGREFNSMALDVTADGSTIVGWSMAESGEEAFYWQRSQGMRSLSDVLVNDYGLDLDGLTLNYATAISDDGNVIVGSGTNEAGNHEAWLAVIPEPSAIVLTAIGAVLTALALLWRRAPLE